MRSRRSTPTAVHFSTGTPDPGGESNLNPLTTAADGLGCGHSVIVVWGF